MVERDIVANDPNVRATGAQRAPRHYAAPSGTHAAARPRTARSAQAQPPRYRASSYGTQRSTRPGAAHTAASAHRAAGAHGVQPVRGRSHTPKRPGPHPAAIIAIVLVLIALVAAIVFLVVPAVTNMAAGGDEAQVDAGVEVQVNIPEGASGDQIAQVLAQNDIIPDPKDYYAAVRELNADMSLKPGDYSFTTLQDPLEVVQQLVDGPNVTGVTLTIQEGLTVEQTAARVEETYGIASADFLAQAKASNYAADYPFLEGAYDDSLEGYLYPKTYSFTTDSPTADDIIRAMLDQFELETADLDLAAGASGLSEQEIVTMASLIERETAVESERPTVASVIYNRLDEGMPLQIDAAIVYARGGGSQTVTYDDLEIDSPYNVYQNLGLTPGPICSPSVSSIDAALHPADTNYLYYVLSASGDGTHAFSETYDEFLQNQQAYRDSRS